MRASGFETYEAAEEAYQAAVARLHDIAVDVESSDRGSFLKAMATAWLRADPPNQRILWPAWEAIITKYGLEVKSDI